MTAGLEICDLSVVFGAATALDSVDMKLEPGSVHALIGPNGAGKTTLVNAVTGVVAPSSGEILLDGRNVTGWGASRLAREGVCRTFQHPQLFATLTPREHLDIVRRSEESNAGALGAEAAAALIRELPDAPASRLGFGDQRLLEFARVTALGPSVVFVDEPVSGLDSAERERMKTLIESLATTAAVCLIEHDMRVVADLASFVTVLDQGRVLAHGTPSLLTENEQVRLAYLGGDIDA